MSQAIPDARVSLPSDARGPGSVPALTLFVCANAARPGRVPSSARRPRPTPPSFGWPWPVQQIVLPCAGRLQPEHVLRAFEGGADAVVVVGCEEDNCHSLDGARRCRRRLEYVRGLLKEIGLGGERLMHFGLPGSATEDMALGVGRAAPAGGDPVRLQQRISEIRAQVVSRLARLGGGRFWGSAEQAQETYEIEDHDESDE